MNGTRAVNWVVYLRIKAGKEIQYTFTFSAHNENEINLYDYPSWNRIALQRVNNYFFDLPGHASTFKNTSGSDVYHVLTGWHKTTSPDGSEPWWQSPAYYDNNRTAAIIGFADSWAPPPFANGEISILRNNQDDCTPYYHEEVPI